MYTYGYLRTYMLACVFIYCMHATTYSLSVVYGCNSMLRIQAIALQLPIKPFLHSSNIETLRDPEYLEMLSILDSKGAAI